MSMNVVNFFYMIRTSVRICAKPHLSTVVVIDVRSFMSILSKSLYSRLKPKRHPIRRGINMVFYIYPLCMMA